MPSNDTTITSTDIYKINQFVDSVKAKYIDIPEDTSRLIDENRNVILFGGVGIIV